MSLNLIAKTSGLMVNKSFAVRLHSLLSAACNPISSDTLFGDASLVTPRRKNVTYTPLDEDETALFYHIRILEEFGIFETEHEEKEGALAKVKARLGTFGALLQSKLSGMLRPRRAE